MKAIIFGVNGQDGYHLKKLIELNGIEVIGISRSSADVAGNVKDFFFVESVIKAKTPDFIFHLAANSTTRHDALFENHETISTGTINILEAVRLHSPKTKVFLSGSAMQFQNEGKPISELTQFEASSPYAVARIQSTYMGRYYLNKFNIKVYIGYFFNHDSALRLENHVNQKVVKAVKRIENGSLEKLVLGNINVKKEFNYAGDIVDAVWKLINQDVIFEVVIGSGKAYSIREWVEYCFKKIDKNWIDFVEVQDNYIIEYDTLVSNPDKIYKIGWQPKVDFFGLADKMMDGII